jgi:hypothetical protein
VVLVLGASHGDANGEQVEVVGVGYVCDWGIEKASDSSFGRVARSRHFISRRRKGRAVPLWIDYRNASSCVLTLVSMVGAPGS